MTGAPHRPPAASPRLIQDPPRARPAGIAIIAAAVLLLSVVPFLPAVDARFLPVPVLLVIGSLLAADVQAFHLSLFTAAFVAVPALFPSLRTWPYALLLPLLCYGAPALMVPRLRRTVLWLCRGRFDAWTVFFVGAIAAVSGTALYVWYAVLNPDLSVHLHHIPAMPVWLLPLAGLAFAAGNAAMEEIVFRGVVMQALDSAGGAGIVSILVQAWLFGAVHFLRGFPNGWWGVAMTFVYGVMLGGLRRQSRGMLAPWTAHGAADLVIFSILASILPGQGGT